MVVNTLASLSSTRYLGPIYDSKKEGRVTIPLVSNETASFYPSMFYDQDKKGPCIRSIQELYSKVMPTLNLKSDEAFFQRLEVEIQDHAENRLQLIFQQFLMVYKTNLHFSLNEKAQHQAGLKHKQSLSIKLEEAHSSTLPCLLLDKDNTQYVFGSDTFFYYAQNMTVKLPKEVNSLDSWIDTTSQEFNDESLRDAAGHLIRHVSTNLENPNGALKLFVRNFLWRLEKFQSTNPNTIQRLISRFYEKVASSYEIQLERSDLLVKTLCFERCSTESLDESFFQNVQKTLHKSFHKDLRVAERREKLVLERPISDTQNTYAKVYLISPTIISLLSAYFS